MEKLQSSVLVGSDETSARVNGKNWWEWVFQNEQVCLHVIKPSRGKKVIEEVMDGHCPEVWVSDLFSSQKANPAENWQVCLAHQLRDCQYAIDAGDDLFGECQEICVKEKLRKKSVWVFDSKTSKSRLPMLDRHSPLATNTLQC